MDYYWNRSAQARFQRPNQAGLALMEKPGLLTLPGSAEPHECTGRVTVHVVWSSPPFGHTREFGFSPDLTVKGFRREIAKLFTRARMTATPAHKLPIWYWEAGAWTLLRDPEDLQLARKPFVSVQGLGQLVMILPGTLEPPQAVFDRLAQVEEKAG